MLQPALVSGPISQFALSCHAMALAKALCASLYMRLSMVHSSTVHSGCMHDVNFLLSPLAFPQQHVQVLSGHSVTNSNLAASPNLFCLFLNPHLRLAVAIALLCVCVMVQAFPCLSC